MRLRLSPEAQACYAYIEGWWRAHREKNPDLFRDEVDRVLSRLPSAPKCGHRYDDIDGVEVRRVLLERTKHHLYYWINTSAGRIEVISIWGTPLEDEPHLRVESSSG